MESRRWWNCWLFHSWGEWSQIERAQARFCRVCGLAEYIDPPHIHNWGKWEDWGHLGYGNNRILGEIQMRRCADCGMQETRTVAFEGTNLNP